MRQAHHHHLPVRTLTLVLFATATHTAFLASNLRDPFILRFGASQCPRFLNFNTSTLNFAISSLSLQNTACTEGALTFTQPPLSNSLGQYMSGEPGAGSILVGSVSEDLVCGRWRFDTRGVFVFVKSEESIRVDWSVVFARNETALHERQPYVFEKDVEHCVINEQCLYTKMSAGEIEMQKGEKCFAGGSEVMGDRGSVKIEKIRTGERVWTGGDMEAVIGWTHRDGRFEGWLVEISAGGRRVTLSAGHYIYVAGGVKQAGDVRVGMRVYVDGREVAVSKVGYVWAKGLYNLHTASGDVVVDGFLCTTYTKAVRPVIAHAFMLPVRLAYAIATRVR